MAGRQAADHLRTVRLSKGLATIAGFDTVAQRNYYEPKDVTAKGVEMEVAGRVGPTPGSPPAAPRSEATGPDGGTSTNGCHGAPSNLHRRHARGALAPAAGGLGRLRWQSDIAKDVVAPARTRYCRPSMPSQPTN